MILELTGIIPALIHLRVNLLWFLLSAIFLMVNLHFLNNLMYFFIGKYYMWHHTPLSL